MEKELILPFPSYPHAPETYHQPFSTASTPSVYEFFFFFIYLMDLNYEYD